MTDIIFILFCILTVKMIISPEAISIALVVKNNIITQSDYNTISDAFDGTWFPLMSVNSILFMLKLIFWESAFVLDAFGVFVSATLLFLLMGQFLALGLFPRNVLGWLFDLDPLSDEIIDD